MIDNEIINDELTFDNPYQKLMYIALKSFAFNGKDKVFPGVKRLASITKMSESKARRTLKDLEDKNLIEIKPRFEDGIRKTNLYIIKKYVFGTVQRTGGTVQRTGGVLSVVQDPPVQRTDKEKELNNNKLNNTKTMEVGSSNPFVFYEQNGFGSLSPFIAEEIGYWIDNHKFDNSEEMIIEAMKIAIKQNVRKWNYVEGILNQWSAKGIKDINMLRAESNVKQQSKKDTMDLIKEVLGDEF